MRRIALLFTLVAGLGFTNAGCGEDGGSLPPGNLSINWLVGASGCESSGINTVAVFISGDSTLGTDLRTFSCSAGGALLSSLPPGVYDLDLRGRDADGVDRFGGQLLGVEVRSNGTTNVQTVRLSALPAEMQVSWYFENGRMCGFNGVAAVDIVLFEDEYEIYSVTADCIAGIIDLTDVQADTYVVDVIGVDESGRALFSGQEEVVLGRGDRKDVEVRLMAISTGPRPTTGSTSP